MKNIQKYVNAVTTVIRTDKTFRTTTGRYAAACGISEDAVVDVLTEQMVLEDLCGSEGSSVRSFLGENFRYMGNGRYEITLAGAFYLNGVLAIYKTANNAATPADVRTELKDNASAIILSVLYGEHLDANGRHIFFGALQGVGRTSGYDFSAVLDAA